MDKGLRFWPNACFPYSLENCFCPDLPCLRRRGHPLLRLAKSCEHSDDQAQYSKHYEDSDHPERQHRGSHCRENEKDYADQESPYRYWQVDFFTPSPPIARGAVLPLPGGVGLSVLARGALCM